MKEYFIGIAPLISGIIGFIAIFVSIYTFRIQIVEQRRKHRADIITGQETRYMNDLVDNLVAVLVGTQRVLVTFADYRGEDKLIREQIHGAEIYHYKLKIFINREIDKERLIDPMNKLHTMMMMRKNGTWQPDEIEKENVEQLLSEILTAGSDLVARHTAEVRKHLGDIGPEFLWISKRNSLAG